MANKELSEQTVPAEVESSNFWDNDPRTVPVPPTAAAVKPPTVAPSESVLIAFEGWVERVADGVATLRLVDREGRRSKAEYAVADLERDNIPSAVGTAFRCQVIRKTGEYRISFQPIPRRKVSEAHRKCLEDEAIAAYSSLENDY